MRVNQNAWLPAQVRYDKMLTDKSKLLFAEISSAVNAYGICDEDAKYFAACINVDVRTVYRCLSQLEDNLHIQKVKEDGRRKLKLINRGLELPAGVEIIDDSPAPISDEVKVFTNTLAQEWGKFLKFKVEKAELYIPLVNDRLNEFTKEDIILAARNRTYFLNENSWFSETPDRWQNAIDLGTFLNSRESILKWLNAKQKTSDSGLHAFNR